MEDLDGTSILPSFHASNIPDIRQYVQEKEHYLNSKMTSFTKQASSFHKIIQTLSIDVIAGAIAVGYFASRILEVEPNPIWWLILPMVVWSFYTLDHLIDGYKSKGKTEIYRHHFHFKYRKLLLILSVLFGLAALGLSLVFLEQQIIILGLFIGSLVLAYFLALFFWGNKKLLLLQKELVIAFVYVFGIWLAPLVWSGQFPKTNIIFIICISILLAWAEGIMASYFDYENDLKDGHSSFTVLFGKVFSRRFLIILHIFVFLFIKVSIFFIDTNLQFAALMILALMNLTLLLIMLFPAWFQKQERYRLVGESVFLLPAIIIFF